MDSLQDKPKRNWDHLKKYHFGKDNPPPTKQKGTKNKITKLTRELLIDIMVKALLIDPETGQKRSTKWLMRELAKAYRKSDKLLLRAIEQIIGKVPEEVHQQVTFILGGLQEPQALEDSTIVDGQFELPEPHKQDDDDK